MSFSVAAGSLRLMAPECVGERFAPPPASPVNLVARCCAWCGHPLLGRRRRTRDHLIPRCGVALLKAAGIEPDVQIVDACLDCNHEKGSIPPLIYFHVRRYPKLLREAQRRWNWVAQRFADHGIETFKPAELAMFAADMKQPMPPGALRGVR